MSHALIHVLLGFSTLLDLVGPIEKLNEKITGATVLPDSMYM